MKRSSRRWVYVIRSVADPERHYVGLTSAVPERLASHNAGESPQTVKNRPWQLVVAIAFSDETRAVSFEKYLKSESGRAFVRRHFG